MVCKKGAAMPQNRMRCAAIKSSTCTIVCYRFWNISAIYYPSFKRVSNGNVQSWVADWPHCCDFGGYTCDVLQWATMVLNASKLQKNTHFHRIVWLGLMGGSRQGPLTLEPIGQQRKGSCLTGYNSFNIRAIPIK